MRHNPLIDQGELERLHEQCFSWALTCVRGRRVEAEDILQMTYLAIVEGEARFSGQSSLRTWLFSVIRNHAASRWRRARRTLDSLARLASYGASDDSTAEPEAAQIYGRSQDRGRVRAALETLPERQCQVLDLVFYRDLPIAEAAEVLGISVGTARVHYERGKAALRARLADLRPQP